MICYRDMTFCGFFKDCKKGNDCNISLTEEVYKKAEEWSKSFSADNVLICQFSEKPDCFEDIV